MYTAITSWFCRPRGGDSPANRRTIRRIRDQARTLESVSDRELADRVAELRYTPGDSTRLRIPVPERRVAIFALTSEALRRTCGKRYFDVQLLAGLALAQGTLAQMQTGEGKTVTTALPAALFALTGEGVHVATTNAYLAARDCHELRPALELLGFSVACLPARFDVNESRRAYRCDVTFGPGYDFGFDFLRDRIQLRRRDQTRLGDHFLWSLSGVKAPGFEPIQRQLARAIIDEADSVLVDEATMPLILSSAPEESAPRHVFELARAAAERLACDRDFSVNPRARRVEFSESGWEKAHQILAQCETLPLKRPWSVYIENALRAKFLLRRNVDYVVRDGAVLIVDQHTGRIHAERNWRDGLHQAVELNEQVELTAETSSDARITRQKYFQRYQEISGMTGTVMGVEREFKQFYGRDTVIIPTHRPSRRRILPPLGFRDGEQRDEAIALEAVNCHRRQQPILIGTRTIHHSLALSDRLTSLGVDHVVLNGIQDEEEATIVAQAGRAGAVTIATNMAGRGTDIRVDAIAMNAGGLHVAAAEPNLSRRVDRQLAGRSARQGEPGSYRFFVAADDELAQQVPALGKALQHAPRDGACSFPLAASVEQAQRELEVRHYQLRRAMVTRDEWVDEILKQLVGKGT